MTDVPPNDAAGTENRVAADFATVTQERAEFSQAGVKLLAIDFHGDVAGKDFEIGDFDACAQVRLVAENRVADIIEVGSLGVVEKQ